MRPERGWLHGVVGACMYVLAGAAAIYAAVKLIEAVWLALVVIAAAIACVAAGVAVVRARRNTW